MGAGGDDLGDDNYGAFRLPADAQAIKIVYKSGGVSCNYKSRGKYSYWGCDSTSDGHKGDGHMGVFVRPIYMYVISLILYILYVI